MRQVFTYAALEQDSPWRPDPDLLGFRAIGLTGPDPDALAARPTAAGAKQVSAASPGLLTDGDGVPLLVEGA